MSEVQHAVFSPSAAHRWFECPGSIRLSLDVPRRSSVYADEGTAAHNLAARCFLEDVDPYKCLDNVALELNGNKFLVTEQMAEAVNEYISTLQALVEDDYKPHIEVRLDLGHLHPGQFGTGDAILYKKKTRHLVVCDFKYGAGVEVTIEDNPQLLSYASGAARQFGAIKQLTILVVQPRINGPHIKKADIPLERLHQFEGEFVAAVARAIEPNASLVPGSYCRFCPAAGVCPALRAKALESARAEFADHINGQTGEVLPEPRIVLPEPKTLSTEELGAVLDHASMIEHWLEAVRRYALDRALLHNDPPAGWKLVRKNTHRKWLDENKAAAALVHVFDRVPNDIWTQKLISPAQAEKLIGKNEASNLSSLIVKPPGDATLAPMSDRREALPVDAREEFSDVLMKQLRDSINHEDTALGD